MKTFLMITLAAFVRSGCQGAPASVTDAVLLGEIDIMTDAEEVEISTEEPETPKKCKFGGTTYAHGQTIATSDACSHCLCVAGEVYCWWQDCLLHSEPEEFDNFEGNLRSSSSSSSSSSSESPSLGYPSANNSSYGNDDNGTLLQATEGLEGLQILDEDGYIDVNSTYQDLVVQSTPPATCVVMGIEYKEGEALPHSTGNCVQCGCGASGRVECSPQDCVPLLQPPSGGGLDLSRGMDEIF